LTNLHKFNSPAHECKEVRDLPRFEYRTTAVIESYWLLCPRCGVKAEKAPLLPGKAPFSKRFEDIDVGAGAPCGTLTARPTLGHSPLMH
jgi:hypothetical protein